MRNPSELRRRLILGRARDDGRVQVTELATVLEVAAETVRRDLRVLEHQGLLRRTHGGATPIDKAGFETHIAQRTTQAVAEKTRIAAAAVKLLGPSESLFIDEGSTALLVAEQLLTLERPMTVVTASLAVAATLATRPQTDVLVLGGRVRRASMAAVGVAAATMLADFTIDLAFMSASGISLDRGASTSDPATADLKRVAMKVAQQRIFVGTHTKFGASSFCRYAATEEFNTMVTDSGLPATVALRYKAAGVRLLRA